MLSVIEVQCPHCGARGTIMLPPIGSVLVGSCPLCNEMVVLFAGRVMALDKEIMLGDDTEAKRGHLTEVLLDYVRERVEDVLNSAVIDPPAMEPDGQQDGFEEVVEMNCGVEPHEHETGAESAFDTECTLDPISRREAEDFVRIDLPLLAKSDYFRAFFGETD